VNSELQEKQASAQSTKAGFMVGLGFGVFAGLGWLSTLGTTTKVPIEFISLSAMAAGAIWLNVIRKKRLQKKERRETNP
jgi:hypothetical protein